MVGTSDRSLPGELIYPGEFVILCDPDFVSVLSPYGRTLGVDNMPALTNAGAYVAIKDLVGNIIHDLTYSTSWYKDATKANGGWSLEMKNPFHSCSGESNWSNRLEIESQ